MPDMFITHFQQTYRLIITGFIFFFTLTSAQAAINLSGTRFIYNQEDSEITVQIHNEGDYPVLLQNWIDDGHADVMPEKLHVPFVLTPPLTRVEGRHGQTLRITATPNNMPADRESVFWLNVLEIPPTNKDGKNQLMVAFRNRVKLFWRPAALKNGATDAPAKLTWRADGADIILSNPTAYYISLTGLHLVQNGHAFTVPAKMIGPSETQRLDVAKATGGKNMTGNESAEIIYINDYGAEKIQKIAH